MHSQEGKLLFWLFLFVCGKLDDRRKFIEASSDWLSVLGGGAFN